MAKNRTYDIERPYISDQYLARFSIEPSDVSLSLDAMVEDGERIMEEQERRGQSKTSKEDTQ